MALKGATTKKSKSKSMTNSEQTGKKKPGVRLKFQGAQLAFLQEKLPEYLDVQCTCSTHAFWNPFFKEWWAKFPYGLIFTSTMVLPSGEQSIAQVSPDDSGTFTDENVADHSEDCTQVGGVPACSQSPEDMSPEELQAKAHEIKTLTNVCYFFRYLHFLMLTHDLYSP
jgi:hypothetical protein